MAMSFEFDPPDNPELTSPGLKKIDIQEDGRDREVEKACPIRIDFDVCDDTGACILVCPEDVIERINGITTIARGEACTECWLCVENCPSSAVEMT